MALLAVVGVAWTLLSPTFGAAILSPSTVKGWWHDLFGSDPSYAERTVDEYVEVARTGTTWVRSPTIYKPSVTYFKEHFSELDPGLAHRFPRADAQPFVSIPDLALGAVTMTGTPVTVAGNINGTPTVITPGKGDVLSYAITLTDRKAARTAVLCRVPMRPQNMTFEHKDRATVAGLVLADGLIQRPDGRGLEHIIYMACSGIAHSTRLELVMRKPDERRRK